MTTTFFGAILVVLMFGAIAGNNVNQRADRDRQIHAGKAEIARIDSTLKAFEVKLDSLTTVTP